MTNILNQPIRPQPDQFLPTDEYDGSEEDWYIMQRAAEIGADPRESVLAVRAAVKRRARLVCDAPADAQSVPELLNKDTGDLTWPPGRAGRIARFIFETSYSPIKEVSITAALGLLAGVCGRAYRTHTGMDLALYIILVAQSGVGKDTLHDGIPDLLELSNRPMARYFLRASDFASGEALHKALLREPGFLYLQGEFGKKLKRMADARNTPMQTFRNIMTMAYGKKFLEGKEYSRAEDSLPGVEWPSLSFLGETTPNTFLECLTTDMMEDGFMSRFLVVSYAGGVPLPNKNRDREMEREDLAVWSALVDHAIKYQLPLNMPQAITVEPDGEAAALLEQFDLDRITHLNSIDDEMERQVWTRPHLKAIKIAALLAVIDNPFKPIVSVEHAQWATDLVRRDMETFLSRKRRGDIGVSDDAREQKLTSFVRDYIVGPVPKSYKVKPQMVAEGIVPRKYLQMRSASIPAFSNHKLGASRALDDAIRSMIANGKLIKAKHDQVVDQYGFHGEAYRIVDL